MNGVKELIDQGMRPKIFRFSAMAPPSAPTRYSEEKGARTGLLVTEGFRGIYEVMEQTRGYGPATYDLFFEKPRLLAPPY